MIYFVRVACVNGHQIMAGAGEFESTEHAESGLLESMRAELERQTGGRCLKCDTSKMIAELSEVHSSEPRAVAEALMRSAVDAFEDEAAERLGVEPEELRRFLDTNVERILDETMARIAAEDRARQN